MKSILKTVLRVFSIFCASPESTIGGQALIEGVMMRNKQKIAWAVRKPDNTIVQENLLFQSLTNRFKFLKLPVLRGAVNLYESLVIGLKTLSRSAEIASSAESSTENKSSAKEKTAMAFSMIVAFAFSFFVFLYLPMKIMSLFIPKESALLFNFTAGAIRVVFFIAYLFLISLMKDIKRVFEYHGAEHKAIAALEAGKELCPEVLKPFSTLHPRCGTSFLLISALMCIILFAFADAIVIHFAGPYPTVIARVLVHLALLPPVAGISYEALKFSSRHSSIFPVNVLVLAGLLLQKITTREPDNAQMETAIKALKAVL
jgi:uncharacterized protein YqhQ